jgi:hypothetical protein
MRIEEVEIKAEGQRILFKASKSRNLSLQDTF